MAREVVLIKRTGLCIRYRESSSSLKGLRGRSLLETQSESAERQSAGTGRVVLCCVPERGRQDTPGGLRSVLSLTL